MSDKGIEKNPTAGQAEHMSVCDMWGESLCGYQRQPGVSMALYVDIGPAVLILSLTAEAEVEVVLVRGGWMRRGEG